MASEVDYKAAKSIYDFKVKDTKGEEVSLDKYKGNVVLVVNIASQCGLTKNNYKKMTELKNLYEDKGLKILSFPCNQFGGQMPEADGEEMVCHLKSANADVGDVFEKVNSQKYLNILLMINIFLFRYFHILITYFKFSVFLSVCASIITDV